MAVNKRFFMDLMTDRRMSLREVAKQMEVWPAALSRSLDGKRKMQLPEAVRLAQVLNIPISDVLLNAGIQEAKTASRRCDIIGHLNENAVVVPLPEGTIERVPVPDGVPDNAVAVQYHTADSPYSFSDGWVTYLGDKRHPLELTGHYSLCCLEDDTMYFAVPRRGYDPGTFNLVSPMSEPIKSARLKWARKCILTIH